MQGNPTMRNEDKNAILFALKKACESSAFQDKKDCAVAICTFLEALPPAVAGLTVPRETLVALVKEAMAINGQPIDKPIDGAA